MKNLLYFIVTSQLAIFTTYSAYSQSFDKPSEGKALVYILRPSLLGMAINFSYYVDSTFIGKANGGNYLKAEVTPGEHIIWAVSENRDFVDAEIEAGKIYLLLANPVPGGLKAGVNLVPVDTTDQKTMKRINKLVSKKGPKNQNAKTVAEERSKSDDAYKTAMKKYAVIKEKGGVLMLAPNNTL